MQRKAAAGDKPDLQRRPLAAGSLSPGKIANTSNAVLATLRDLMFRLNLAPTPKFPVLTDGVLARAAKGKLQAHAGTVPGQGRVAAGDTVQRLDELTGFGFVLLSRGDILPALSSRARQIVDDLRITSVVIGAEGVQDLAASTAGCSTTWGPTRFSYDLTSCSTGTVPTRAPASSSRVSARDLGLFESAQRGSVLQDG